ncbi:LysM domain-containing protein [Colletotrichum somersetense]|nr:LysM domain-containing protein [Colletotrichum somersetense]
MKLALRLWAPALAFHLSALLGVINAQQFTDVKLGYAHYPNLSQSCYQALNTTVQDCPGFLATHAASVPRLESHMLEALCTSGCKSSLTTARRTIALGCGARTDVVEFDLVVYPATYMIDRIIHAYDLSCAQDGNTGVFCDEVYLDNLANDTTAGPCSRCSLGTANILLNSPFGFDTEFAADFKSRTSSCGAAGYDFTTPAAYAVTTKPVPTSTDGPVCPSPYTVKSGDTCDSIATAYKVSTNAVIRAGITGPGCKNLVPGVQLCLPEACAQYRVKWDDSCANILKDVPGLQAQHLLTWNPNISPLCTNLRDMVGDLICVSPPGRTLADATAVPSGPPTTTQPPATAVPRPSNAKAESHQMCAAWYEIKAGDYCQMISIKNSVEVRDFFFLNPSVDNPGCGNLWLNTSYCVQPVGDINTYPSYPYSTSPPYTLTPSDYVTTTQPAIETIAPSETPVADLPLASGSLDEADGCREFVEHVDVPIPRDQSQQPDVPQLTKNINTCDYVVAEQKILMDDFIEWNPSLRNVSPCVLQPNLRYCGAYGNATADPDTSNGGCLEVQTPEPGTVDNCACFTKVDGFNAGKFLCADIAEDKNITVSDLVKWNTWIGTESDCDKGLYANLDANAERGVCVKAGPGRPTEPVEPPGPTQPGIVEGCQNYYVAVSGDGCWAIANANGIDLADFYEWNPALNGDCSGLWPTYAYCVRGPASSGGSDPVNPPGPTQEGITTSCKKYHLVVSGDGCWAIQQKYGIADYATFVKWNPALGSDCQNLWPDYAVCVGV